MKKVTAIFFIIFIYSAFINAQVRIDRNADYYLADVYTLTRTSPTSNITQVSGSQASEGPTIGRDTINHVESCGIRVIRFLLENNVGENPRAERTGDKATISITMNNVYEPYHQLYPVYTQSSWAAHRYVVVLLDNSVANLTASQQWAAVWNGTVIATKRYDDNTPIDIKSYINQSNSDRITFGIRAEYQNNPISNPWAAPSSSIFGFIGTVLQDEQISVIVKNNFAGGKIKAAVNNSAPPELNAPVTITDMTRKTLYIGAVEGTNQPAVGGYNYVFNDTEAPSNNISVWYKEYNNVRQANFSNNANTSLLLSSAEKNYSYVADMKKVCNVTFQNSLPETGNTGSVTVDGTSYSVTKIVQKVEGNSVSFASASQSVTNGVASIFDHWTGGSTASSSSATINAHTTITAFYKGKASTASRNLRISSTVGQPDTLKWSDHPSAYVTQYKIYRKVRPAGGTTGSEVLIATVSKGTTTYVDHDYIVSNSLIYQVYYDVRYVYSGQCDYVNYTTESDMAFVSTFADESLLSQLDNSSSNKKVVAKEVPSNYSISNYPNPFNPTTTINYQLPSDGMITLKVYDVIGKEVATLVNAHRAAGTYNVEFNASGLPSGIYIYRLNANNFTESKKMLLMK
jgi:hypothetical protein